MLGQKLRMPFEPLQTDWFRKRNDDPSAPRSCFAWQGSESQDLIAFYDPVIEVSHFLLTSKAGHVDPFCVATPNFSLQSLRTNKQWSLLDSGGDVTVGLCLEGFVLFDDLQLVNLCHDLVFLDVHWQTACLRRLQRQHGLDCDVTIFFKFWKFYSEIVAPAHDSRVALMTRNLAPRNVIRVIGDCIPEERLEQVLCALRLVEAFDDLFSKHVGGSGKDLICGSCSPKPELCLPSCRLDCPTCSPAQCTKFPQTANACRHADWAVRHADWTGP